VVGQDVGALRKHIALIGMMGAGKTTVGREVAELIQRPFVDLDRAIEGRHGRIPQIFEERGEEEFRRLEEQSLAEALAGPRAVIALGGGAVLSPVNRERLGAQAFTVFLDVDVATAWERSRGSDRPLAQREEEFRRLFESRLPVYLQLGDAVAHDADSVLLGALRIVVPGGILTSAPAVVIADERVLELHGAPVDDAPLYPVPPGEQAKTLAVAERLLNELAIGREGTIVVFGGGSTTDVGGFVAAAYLRGVSWIAVPTTLTGMVDAAIGGKTGVNTDAGKNLVGAFHFPQSVVIDPTYLSTLPREERRAGMAEVVKTGLLAGRELWSLPEQEMIRACAAFKAAVVLADPFEEWWRGILNLGHTFAHALEAGSGYTVRHGDAVALGLLAALRLSGQPTDVVEEVLHPEPVRADPDAAWTALKRDKKGEGVFVLLEGPGEPTITTVPDKDARQALEALIRK
jgi:3-dehydroquinate synthetase/shikimate kinase